MAVGENQQELDALAAAGLALGSAANLGEALQIVAEAAARAARADVAVARVADDSAARLTAVAVAADSSALAAELAGSRIPLGGVPQHEESDVSRLPEGVQRAAERAGASAVVLLPVHVDGASGGMVAPFLDPELVWDFRLPRVASINTSGHKYGLVYPGVGWIVWRDVDALPDELIFRVNYLGDTMPTFALNFSRPGSEVRTTPVGGGWSL